MKNHIEKYLKRYAEKGPWKLTTHSLAGIQNAVVIPALAEYPGIIETLHSLALNDPKELKRTLIICIVNNRPLPCTTAEIVDNNQATLSLFKSLVNKEPLNAYDPEQRCRIGDILNSEIRLAYVDASSAGFELPPEAGVGLARKIAIDLFLSSAYLSETKSNLLLNLDADTIVESNYLRAAVVYFRKRGTWAAVVSFNHRQSQDSFIQEAIAYYESYLRYHVMGLQFAASPYAFYTIGSTMVTRADAYAMARGMPKRLAAEDFYFLNKLAKLGHIGLIAETKVSPSPRLSTRTPFGTGRNMEQLIQNTNNERMLYDPQVYCILGRWLALINQSCDESGEQIVNRAAEEHPELREFLDRAGFVGIWEKLQRNDPQRKNLIRQFHAWFDGLKTLKLIHHLTEKGHSKLPVYQAVKGLQMLIGSPETERCTLTDRSTMVAVRSLLLKMEMTAKRHAGIEISP